MIYTFYSYKGGVGRSMALANVAELLYRAGLKVLMVDWDLEAPGLERFFPAIQALDHIGLVDMLIEYKQKMAQPTFTEDTEEVDLPLKSIDPYLINVYKDSRNKGKLYFMSSGKRSGEYFNHYASIVRAFDWQDFYQNWEGELFFEWLRQRFEELVDVILIDSRTGISEIGGVCTYQLADIVVMFCTTNQQSIDGTYEMARSLMSDTVNKIRRERPLQVIIVPARVEDRAEANLFSSFNKEFLAKFENRNLSRDNPLPISVEEMWDLRIPHVPFYAFNETVVVRENPIKRHEDMYNVFVRIYTQLSLLAPKDSSIYANIHDKLGKNDKTESKNRSKDIRVGIWGPRAAGKTTYITMIWAASLAAESRWIVRPNDIVTQEHITGRLSLLMNRGEFPEPTRPQPEPTRYSFYFSLRPILTRTGDDEISRYSDNLAVPLNRLDNWTDVRDITTSTSIQDTGLTISLTDAAGEQYLTDSPESPLWDDLWNCDGLICLLDPAQAGEHFEITLRLVQNLWLKSQQYSSRLINNMLPHYVALCFTKIDQSDFYEYRDRPEDLLNNLTNKTGIDLLSLMRSYFEPQRIRLFSISSVGVDESNQSLVQGYQIKNVRALRPINIITPLHWLLESLNL